MWAPDGSLFKLPALAADTPYGVNLFVNNAAGSKIYLDNIKYESYPNVSMKSCLFDVDKGLVTVLFDGPVDMAAVSAESFAVTDASGAPLTITGISKRDASSVNVLLEEALAVGEQYTVETKDGMKDMFGMAVTPKALTDTAKYSSLTVLSTSPENGQTEVPKGTPIVITVSTPFDKDTVKAGVSVTCNGEAVQDFALSYPANDQLQVDLRGYSYGAVYRVSLAASIMNEYQNPMQPYSFAFTITNNDEQPVYFNDFEKYGPDSVPEDMTDEGSPNFRVKTEDSGKVLHVQSVEGQPNPLLSHGAPLFRAGEMGKRKISFKIKGVKGFGGFFCGFYNQSTSNAFTQYLDFERAYAMQMLDVGGGLRYEIDYDEAWHTVEAYVNRTGGNAMDTAVFWDGKLLGTDALAAAGMEKREAFISISVLFYKPGEV